MVGRVFSSVEVIEFMNHIDEDEEEDEITDDLNEMAEYGVDSALISDQKWEDLIAFNGIRARYSYPHILKVINYTPRSLQEQEEWLAENCREKWERIGWSSGCSYTVALGFKNHIDAVMYRLRWN